MKYEITGEKIVIYPEGDVDIITADEFKTACVKLIEDNALPVLFDCVGIEFIDSTGLGAFVAIHKAAVANNVSVSLIRLKPTVKKLFVITKLDDVIAIGDAQ